jgi:rhodanese-related sulfurtransferase
MGEGLLFINLYRLIWILRYIEVGTLKILRLSSIILILIVTLANLSACGNEKATQTGLHVNVNAKEAKALIDGGIEVLDVRTPEEYAEGHIKEAKLLPLQELDARLDELDKNTPYLLICRSGNRSSQAQVILKNAGFIKTYNTLGGMNEWPYETEK